MLLAGAMALFVPSLFGGQSQPGQAQTFAEPDTTGFAHVDGPIPLSFPADHGAHPSYQTEWWYYTGNLATAQGRRFGYQLTFFRRALSPLDNLQERQSDWAASQAYLAHFALTDVGGQNFHSQARLSRGAAGLAGVQADPLRVWIENWFASMSNDSTHHIFADGEGRKIDLVLDDMKGPVLQGDRGYSRKGPQAGNASIYYSLTRMESSGTVQVDGVSYDVTGLSWMDREFSTSALAPNQVGWDWFSLQLDNNVELMFYNMRLDDGTIDPMSNGTVIDRDGKTQLLDLTEFQITSTGTWKSPHSGAVYPSGWHIAVPSQDISLDIEPLLADQELNVSLTYWEGAVKISGRHNGQVVSGFGYVELTGYKASISSLF
jgi:predicted secreted hydrolase